MKTVGQLKGYLKDKDDDLPVDLMIEAEGIECQYPLNGFALVRRYKGNADHSENVGIVLCHQKRWNLHVKLEDET